MQRSGSSLSVVLPSNADLLDDEFYEVTVDARTEVGYNDSLHLQSVILPSNASGAIDSVQYCKIRLFGLMYIFCVI